MRYWQKCRKVLTLLFVIRIIKECPKRYLKRRVSELNADLLLAKIKEEDLSIDSFLQSIHMPVSVWNKKIQGLNEFDREEMQRIIASLALKDIDVMVIFFDQNVS